MILLTKTNDKHLSLPFRKIRLRLKTQHTFLMENFGLRTSKSTYFLYSFPTAKPHLTWKALHFSFFCEKGKGDYY